MSKICCILLKSNYFYKSNHFNLTVTTTKNLRMKWRRWTARREKVLYYILKFFLNLSSSAFNIRVLELLGYFAFLAAYLFHRRLCFLISYQFASFPLDYRSTLIQVSVIRFWDFHLFFKVRFSLPAAPSLSFSLFHATSPWYFLYFSFSRRIKTHPRPLILPIKESVQDGKKGGTEKGRVTRLEN